MFWVAIWMTSHRHRHTTLKKIRPSFTLIFWLIFLKFTASRNNWSMVISFHRKSAFHLLTSENKDKDSFILPWQTFILMHKDTSRDFGTIRTLKKLFSAIYPYCTDITTILIFGHVRYTCHVARRSHPI